MKEQPEDMILNNDGTPMLYSDGTPIGTVKDLYDEWIREHGEPPEEYYRRLAQERGYCVRA